jgi:hypothetical protein
MHVTALTEPAYRVKRRRHAAAAAALTLLLCYACDKLGVRLESFVLRIGTTNTHSIALFASLEFGIVSTVSIFDQVGM